jgi:DinB superfamily
MSPLQNISNDLKKIISEAKQTFDKMTLEEWNFRSTPAKWSKKEILGHLIDSAANNHQRFVRAQFEDTPSITYSQDNWVSFQKYFDEPVENIIELWISYNKHLAYLISKIPEDKLKNCCDIMQDKQVTLEWVIIDYVRHLKYHLDQIILKV